ncbi:MAG TPA: DUF4331 family protein [Allosphingosinicella sp.]|jgi:hypothetical protein
MGKFNKMLVGTALAGCVVIGLSGISHRDIVAADHLDAPTRTDPAFDGSPDRPADIADIYAWHTSTDIIVALTFAGPNPANQGGTYDRDVLYEINISNDGNAVTTEFPIQIRFGFDGNRPGVRVTGLPGNASVEGPVEQTLSVNNMLVRAGLYDDPFYFDLQGFRETRAMGTLRFNNQRDFFAGQNDTGVVIQIPRALVQQGNQLIHVWSAASRFGGNL